MFLQSPRISIGFDNPYALLLLVPSALIITYLYLLSRRRISLLSSRLPRLSSSRYSTILTIAKILTAFMLPIAIAQPYIVTYNFVPVTPDNILNVNTTVSNIVILVDISKSMGYSDTYPSRIDNAIDLVIKISEYALKKRDVVEVYGFSDSIKKLCIINNSSSAYECYSKLKNIKLEKFSAIGDAIFFGLTKAKASAIPTAIIVITDGGWNYGSPIESAVEASISMGIPLTIVLVGSDTRSTRLENICREKNVDVLRVSMFSSDEDVLNHVSEGIYVKAKYEALKTFNKLFVEVVHKDYFIQTYILMLVAIFVILSMVEGL